MHWCILDIECWIMMKLAQIWVNLNFNAEKSVRLLEIESVAEVELAPSWSQFSRGRWIAAEESIQPNITFNSLCPPPSLSSSLLAVQLSTENKWKYIYDTLSQPPCNVQLADPWPWGWPANWQWVGLLTHRACGQQLTPLPVLSAISTDLLLPVHISLNLDPPSHI